ncbi:MAG: hypothetical protein KF836_12085 [Fimbriimonadaceae bacterium]|nr:hypothetical protein [Fimbriimonadaceae bacterium]
MEDSTPEQIPPSFLPDFEDENQLYKIWLAATKSEQEKLEFQTPPDEYYETAHYRIGVILEAFLRATIITLPIYLLNYLLWSSFPNPIPFLLLGLLITLGSILRIRYPKNFRLRFISRWFYKAYRNRNRKNSIKTTSQSDLNFQSLEVLVPIAKYVLTPTIETLNKSNVDLYHQTKYLQSKREQLEKLARRLTDEIAQSSDEAWKSVLRPKLTHIGTLINKTTQDIAQIDSQAAEIRIQQVGLENQLAELVRRKRLMDEFKQLDSVSEHDSDFDIRASLTAMVENARTQLETIERNTLAYESAKQEINELLDNSS